MILKFELNCFRSVCASLGLKYFTILKLNKEKTKITIISNNTDLPNTNKLSSILDDQGDIKRRNQLDANALSEQTPKKTVGEGM